MNLDELIARLVELHNRFGGETQVRVVLGDVCAHIESVSVDTTSQWRAIEIQIGRFLP